MMTRRVVWIAAAALAAVALLIWALRAAPSRPAVEAEEILEVPTPTPAPEQRVVLVYPGRDGLLHPELRTVPLPAELDKRVRVVLRELFAGSTRGRARVLPYPGEVLGVYVDGAGNAFVDLTGPPEPMTGSHSELMLTYGVVNSILLNCPELHAVQLLFSGREVTTLSGHLDLSRPLALNKRLIAPS